jgi:zinc metalloprotease ZmpB
VLASRRSRLAGSVAVIAALATLGAGAGAGASSAASSTASGRVFFINPVQSSGNESLSDDKDSDAAVPASAYKTVTLTNLDGSGRLVGDYANVVSETGDPAIASGGTFNYTRHDDRFEQVMAYYWVTEAQKYIQRLGFTGAPGALRAVNKESQDVRINQYGADNSFSWDKKDLLRFGKGGVDDAEDGEVIVHEYGHAVHDAQVPGFGTSEEAGSIGEAWGDYLAVSVGLAVAGPPAKGVPAACVMDWDATSYTSTVPHCLRRLDTNLTVANKSGEVHHDGMIWSRALWDIRAGLGATKADRVIIDAQFDFAPDTSFAAAARATVAKAKAMYGDGAAATVRSAFEARGIL